MTLLSSSLSDTFRDDQARVLRERMATTLPFASEQIKLSTKSATAIAVAGGKGGVGKSVIALNLAIALSQLQHRVLMVDASFGLGHLDFLAGQNSYWNLGHVLAGARDLDEIVLPLFPDVDLVTGGSDMSRFGQLPTGRQQRLQHAFEQLHSHYDFVVVDCGSGYHPLNQHFVEQADLPVLVTTTEPTSITNTYSCLKKLSQHTQTPLIVFNQAEVALARRVIGQLKQTAAAFLHNESFSSAVLPLQVGIAQDVTKRYPTLLAEPISPFSEAIKRLALQLICLCEALPAPAEKYFTRLSRL